MRCSASSGASAAADSGFARQSSALRRLDDQLREALAAVLVEAVGLRIFVNKTFEFKRVAGKAAGNKRRRQMTDRYSRRSGVLLVPPRPDC